MWKGTVHQASQDDLPFLWNMLYLAVCWNSDVAHPSQDELLARPELKRLFEGWGKKGDTALIAFSNEGKRLGAAWYRYWNQSESSYGFVNENTPELGIAVIEDMRQKGIGYRLLCELLKQASLSGAKQISLSVDPENAALLLYDRLGFRKVGEEGTSWTMLAVLEESISLCTKNGV